jgi:chemotaxis protein MotB
MTSEAPDIVFIRRSLRRRQEAPHGGVWKIAFADFMTAMMAFFLVMWLISATDQKTRETVASYFNPVKLAAATVDKKGLRDPQEVDKDRSPEATGRPTSEKSGDQSGSGDTRISDHRQASHERKPRFSEAALFEDPYAVLAALVAGSEPGQAADKVGAFETRGQSGEPGLNGGEAQRDPFDPVYWKMARAPQTQARDGKETGGAKTASAGTTAAEPAPPPPAAAPEATPPRPVPTPKETAEKAVAAETAERTEPPPPVTESAPAPTPTSEPLAEARPADQKRETAKPAPDAPAAQATQAARAETRELGRRIEAAVQTITPAPGVQVQQTADGVLVTLMDDADFGMFAIGSAEPQPELIRAVDAIGKVIAGQKGGIVVRGHTDGRPFRSRDYDNWRLSTARAHMAYYMLVRGGVAKERFERIEGYADQQLKRRDDPAAPQNRRIEILIRRPAA